MPDDAVMLRFLRARDCHLEKVCMNYLAVIYLILRIPFTCVVFNGRNFLNCFLIQTFPHERETVSSSANSAF